MDTQHSSDSLDPRHLHLVRAIAAASGPVGAREIIRRMADSGLAFSESTVNRMLRRLDEMGLTRSVDGKGRVLSERGRAVAQRAERQRRWQQGLGQLELRTLHDVRDLLVARRGLEREIARAVALRASEAEIAELRRVLAGHTHNIKIDSIRRAAAVDFHKALAVVSQNSILQAVATVLFDPRFDLLEQVLDIITADRGTTEESTGEHEALLAAIERRDPDEAEQAMVRHIDRLIADASVDVAPSTVRAIEHLLRQSGQWPDDNRLTPDTGRDS